MIKNNNCCEASVLFFAVCCDLFLNATFPSYLTLKL